MNKDIYDILESCLQELENGVEIDDLLSRHPGHAKELRPILNASLKARSRTVPPPTQAATIRNRARLMQKVTEIQNKKSAPRKHAIPLFQRLAISFTVTVTLLLSGNSLVGASSTALPGQNLYPVKRGWENIRLFFTFNEEARNYLEEQFEGERLEEIGELLSNESDDDRHLVDFSGILTIANGTPYISEVRVLFPAGTQLPPQGTALHVTGWTTEKGYVEIISFEILPAGSIIPGGFTTPFPVIEDENEPGEESQDENKTDEKSRNETESDKDSQDGTQSDKDGSDEKETDTESQDEKEADEESE
jgi:hypothetical protein